MHMNLKTLVKVLRVAAAVFAAVAQIIVAVMGW